MGPDPKLLANYYIGQKAVGGCLTPGIRLWNNGFPIKADTYKSCTNHCTYCFARALTASSVERGGVRYDPRVARVVDAREVAGSFSRMNSHRGWVYWALRNRYMIECGTMGEIFQEADWKTHATWNFLNLCRAHHTPLFINTKANLLIRDPAYFEALATHPAPVAVCMTLISHEDEPLRRYEPAAPSATERLDLIKKLADVGIPTTIYCGPFIRGLTDRDIDGYINAAIDAGAVGMHLRNLYLTGKLLRRKYWTAYAERNAAYMRRSGMVMEWEAGYLEDVYHRMQAAAEARDPRFRIVGMKTSWLDLEPYHGKMAWDWLPQPFKDAVVDFTAIPILRAIRSRVAEPQLLRWGAAGFREGAVELPEDVYIKGGPFNEGRYLGTGCQGCVAGNIGTSGKESMSGYGWLRAALWGAEGSPISASFLSTLHRILPVYENGVRVTEPDGTHVHAYVPLGQEAFIVGEKTKAHVPWESARGFVETRRPGGTEDKFWDEPLVDYQLGGRWA